MSSAADSAGLERLYSVFQAANCTPGWAKKSSSLWPAPRTEFQPMHWSYRDARERLMQASAWIGLDLAERRNLVLFNPVPGNEYATLRTLVAAYQVILPGERARPHRHSPHALRVVIDDVAGIATVVDGKRVEMRGGDIVLTPGGQWHSHYHAGTQPACWIDVLDVPLVQLLEPMFFEHYPARDQPEQPAPSPCELRISRGDYMRMLQQPERRTGGVASSKLPVDALLPSMTLAVHAIDAEAAFDRAMASVNRLYIALEGQFLVDAGAKHHECSRGDVVAIPTWTAHRLVASRDSVVLEISDEQLMRKLALYRELNSNRED